MRVHRRGTLAPRARAAAAIAGSFSLLAVATAHAQTISAVPDAQVEANVLKALAGVPELSAQDIQSSTVYGVVTLSGTVQTEALRTHAENLVARTTGVKKVVDELTLGNPTSAANAGNDQGSTDSVDTNTQPVLQSDGSYAPPDPAQPATPYGGVSNQSAGVGNQAGSAQPAPAYGNPPSYPNAGQSPYAQSGASQPYGSQPGYNQPSYGQNGYPPQPQGYSQPQGYPAQPGYGQPSGYPQQAYNQPPQGYAPAAGYAPPGGQPAGVPVVVPAGVLLRIRINRGLDSNHIQPGATFDGTVLNDITTPGEVAIPRGATVQGTVVDSRKAGALKGHGELALQINTVTLGGTTYPFVSDLWEREGRDKSVGTVNSALGLGVLGAIVGGVAGGGAGAAVGAGLGAGVGVAGSAASPGGRVIVPPEAVLTFHLAQAAQIRTVSESEMQRLAYAAGPAYANPQPVMRRRYPAYYAPAPYPYPY